MNRRGLRLFLLAWLLLADAAGARVYTVAGAEGARRYFGPAPCYAGIPDGLERISKGQRFSEALREFFFRPLGGEPAIGLRRSAPEVSELEKLDHRPELQPAPDELRLEPAPEALSPPLPQAPLSRDLSPVAWPHLESKK